MFGVPFFDDKTPALKMPVARLDIYTYVQTHIKTNIHMHIFMYIYIKRFIHMEFNDNKKISMQVIINMR